MCKAFGIDGYDDSTPAIDWACDLAERTGATLELVMPGELLAQHPANRGEVRRIAEGLEQARVQKQLAEQAHDLPHLLLEEFDHALDAG